MSYKKTYTPSNGYTELSTVGESTLKMLEFGILELDAGQSIDLSTGTREAAFILLSGKASFSVDKHSYGTLGVRRSVFEGKAEAFYAPREKTVAITSLWHTKIAVCKALTDLDTEPQVIRQADVREMMLGQKPWQRMTTFIVDGATNAKRLTIGEAYVTPGNWAGFPPHKHDESLMPAEGIAEEIYYFLFQPEQGFALQCMYTEDGEIDETYRVRQDEFVEFPRGYHTTVGAPGYNTYFLWMMAGEHQGFYRANDPAHEWVSAVENLLKKL